MLFVFFVVLSIVPCSKYSKRLTCCLLKVGIYLIEYVHDQNMWCSTSQWGTLWNVQVSHFINMIMVYNSHFYIYIYILIMYYEADKNFEYAKQKFWKTCFKKQLTKTKNVANIDHLPWWGNETCVASARPTLRCVASHIKKRPWASIDKCYRDENM